MIFFLINKDDQSPYPEATNVTKYREERRAIPLPDVRIIPWSEVYSTFDKLKKAILDAARQDPMCKAYRMQSIKNFGLDPFKESQYLGTQAGVTYLSENEVDEILNKTFLYFAHPLIGNIGNSSFQAREVVFTPERWASMNSDILQEVPTALRSQYPDDVAAPAATTDDDNKDYVGNDALAKLANSTSPKPVRLAVPKLSLRQLEELKNLIPTQDRIRDTKLKLIATAITKKKRTQPQATPQKLYTGKQKYFRDQMETLYNLSDLPKLDQAGRDQMRLVSNIVELARMFIGEVTTNPTRRLERILALGLCQSTKLQNQGAALLRLALDTSNGKTSVITKITNTLQASGNGPVGAKFQYLRYFYADADTLRINQAVYILERLMKSLVDQADGYTYTLTSTYNDRGDQLWNKVNTAWQKLPKTIQLAIMFNDIRNILKQTNPPGDLKYGSYSYDFSQIYDALASDNGENKSIAVTQTRPIANPPKDFLADGSAGGTKVALKQFKNFWSWNRNEYRSAIETYRYFLMPMWAGPSGHMTGMLKMWNSFIIGEENFPNDGWATMCSCLFAFWRIYYDRRLSSAHTLVEAYEAMTNEFTMGCANPGGSLSIEFIDKTVADNLNDLYDVLDTALVYPPRNEPAPDDLVTLVHPIKLMEQLRQRYYVKTQDEASINHSTSYAALQTEINRLRDTLVTGDIFLPQFSKEFSSRSAFQVRQYITTQSTGDTVVASVANTSTTQAAPVEDRVLDHAYLD